MKFQITIKEQSQAINGKAKYPLYKAANQKTFDQDRGLEILEEFIQSSSIKIFCDECQKEITLETIVVAYEGQKKPQLEKHQNLDTQKQNITSEEKKSIMEKENYKQKVVQEKLSKLKFNKRIHNKNQVDEIFQEKDSSYRAAKEEIESDSEQMQQQNPLKTHNTSKPQSDFHTKSKDLQAEASQESREVTHLYCVGCFACLQKFPPFYSIRKNLKFSPLNSNWAVFDEINLLNGLKFWGFGNWGQIKEFMDYNSSLFTVNQIEEHYEQLYLKGEGLKFPPADQFDISKAHKPAKKILEEIMHEYYFPSESQENINIQEQNLKESQNKKGKDLAEIRSMQRKESERHPTVGQSSKQLRKENNFLSDAVHPSNTSLQNFNDERQRNAQATSKNQKMDEEQNSEFSEESEDSQMQEEAFPQLQLKPRSSSQIHDSKISRKGINQGFSRTIHISPEQPRSHQQSFPIHHQNEPSSISISPTKLKGQNVYSYNPKRKEFEIFEYDYYAESMIALLEFTEEDTEEEINLKIKIIEEYNHRLDQRIKRREFVIEHRLLDTDFMVKTLSKYNKPNFQIFQPFRRLINKNLDYFQVLDSYNRMSKANSLAQGFVKLNKKLKSKHKHPQLKHFIDYLNQKKEKKQLLGKRARYQNEAERRVLLKQGSKLSKKIIIQMQQNSHSYVNVSSTQLQALSPSNHQQAASRTMTSRSEERQKLRMQNQSTNREQQQPEITNENVNFSNLGTTNRSLNFMNSNSTSLLSILSQQEIDNIERFAKRQTFANFGIQDFKPLTLKSYTLQPLNLHKLQKN